ncbi:MAG: C-factor [Pelagibacterium sp. SCN 63-23]|nr:MAG: C-factor [Pelagibacterium sp. SCN 63-23]
MPEALMTYDQGSFPSGGLAVVIGASGGIGHALQLELASSASFEKVVGFSRSADGFDLTDEATIARAASAVATMGMPLRLVILATGLLHEGDMQPEKSLRQLKPEHMARSFAINAIGPILVAKHFLPLLSREGKAVFAAVSAKVGSIEDNHLGGWYGYRAAKAALNQFIRTASIELRRTHPDAICVALHPGTVATSLSAPFRSSNHAAVEPAFAAERMLRVIDGLRPADTGVFFDHTGLPLPW